MRALVLTFFASIAFFGAAFGYTELVANSRHLALTSVALRDWAEDLEEPPQEEDSALVAAAFARARIYDDQIIARHLVDGMVVGRHLATGAMRDACDSLLFSSLRFVSLTKLGFLGRAQDAWAGIQNANIDGHWHRHPRCLQSTSRDMLLGLLAALSQEPPGYAEHLRKLMTRVDHNNGYFSSGPVYVSYLSPGLARFIGMIASARLGGDHLPDIIRDGYSTAELEVMVTEPGYTSHLGALTAWLEMELTSRHMQRLGRNSLLASAADVSVAPFAEPHLASQRLDWITDRLVHTDPTNLFYRYLRLRAADALTPAVRHGLLAELMAMPQFPPDRLPANCDRRADYVWQREIRDLPRRPVPCTEEYTGTDFLWMAGLLLEGEGNANSVIEVAH